MPVSSKTKYSELASASPGVLSSDHQPSYVTADQDLPPSLIARLESNPSGPVDTLNSAVQQQTHQARLSAKLSTDLANNNR